MFSSTVGTLFAAGTTGTISGTITDANGTAVSGVVINATSPTGQYKTTTDAKGFFSISDVNPDTYTVSITKNGFEPQVTTGVTVVQDGVATVNAKIAKSLSQIVKVTSRGIAGAYQPTQTQDSYTVGQAQIETIQGREKNTNEANLLVSLPGASLDSSGYPVLRGGRENEEGFQFEGIPITDSYTNQFQNSLSVNGIGSFQLVPGSGNASVGNSGTGSVNYTAKRGTYPANGSIEVEAQTGVYDHQLSLDYGFANPQGTVSNYFSFIGQRTGNQVGPFGFPANENGEFNGGQQDFEENNFVDNFVFKFGKNNNNELQLLYQTQVDRFGLNYGGQAGVVDALSDPYDIANGGSGLNYYGFLGFTNADTASVFAPLPNERATLMGSLGQSVIYQPEALYKAQLTHNFNASTFLRLAYYGVDSVSIFDLPDPNYAGGRYEPQGSLRHGATLDFTKQLNSQNLLTAGGKYEYNHPIFGIESNSDSALAIGAGTLFGFEPTQGFEYADFLNPNNTAACTAAEALGAQTCGYLAQYFPNGVKAPLYDRTSQFDRADYASYVNDQYSPNDHIKIEGGLRVDGNTTLFPATFDGAPTNVPRDASHPLILEPRLATSFQIGRADAIRLSYGRSTQFAPLADVARTIQRSDFNEFNFVPSYNNLTGTVATNCGAAHTTTCANYGDQLFNEYQALASSNPIQPVKPETFTTFDASYSHNFGSGIGIKVTPFYTRGYDIIDDVANVIGTNPATNQPLLGPELATNLGIEKTTGVEFLLTREARYGFSGQLAATYINKLSNVPPLVSEEDFFPAIPAASLDLGNLYRVGYLSPFQATLDLQYKTRGGLRINPQITYNKGYPISPGNLTAVFVNGIPENVPLTDVTGPQTGTTPGQFVDPANPGSVTKPNIQSTLGTPATASNGGALSNARFFTNLTIEFSPPTSRSTFGAQIFNLFDELYGRPSVNGAYQPVATGVGGPQSGLLPGYAVPFATEVPYLANTPASEFGGQPYNILYGNTPTTVLLYYQLKI